MRKAYSDKEPNNCFLVEVDPEVLRNIANRIEYKLSISTIGQTVTVKLTDEITLFSNVEKLDKEKR